jgi:hypothetical protein
MRPFILPPVDARADSITFPTASPPERMADGRVPRGRQCAERDMRHFSGRKNLRDVTLGASTQARRVEVAA